MSWRMAMVQLGLSLMLFFSGFMYNAVVRLATYDDMLGGGLIIIAIISLFMILIKFESLWGIMVCAFNLLVGIGLTKKGFNLNADGLVFFGIAYIVLGLVQVYLKEGDD